jgi:hypothetical protein
MGTSVRSARIRIRIRIHGFARPLANRFESRLGSARARTSREGAARTVVAPHERGLHAVHRDHVAAAQRPSSVAERVLLPDVRDGPARHLAAVDDAVHEHPVRLVDERHGGARRARRRSRGRRRGRRRGPVRWRARRAAEPAREDECARGLSQSRFWSSCRCRSRELWQVQLLNPDLGVKVAQKSNNNR